MPLLKAVLRLKRIIFVETHRGGQNILVLVSSTKTGLCLINHVLPNLAECLANTLIQ